MVRRQISLMITLGVILWVIVKVSLLERRQNIPTHCQTYKRQKDKYIHDCVSYQIIDWSHNFLRQRSHMKFQVWIDEREVVATRECLINAYLMVQDGCDFVELSSLILPDDFNLDSNQGKELKDKYNLTRRSTVYEMLSNSSDIFSFSLPTEDNPYSIVIRYRLETQYTATKAKFHYIQEDYFSRLVVLVLGFATVKFNIVVFVMGMIPLMDKLVMPLCFFFISRKKIMSWGYLIIIMLGEIWPLMQILVKVVSLILMGFVNITKPSINGIIMTVCCLFVWLWKDIDEGLWVFWLASSYQTEVQPIEHRTQPQNFEEIEENSLNEI